jgi:hypothetical protein
MHRSFGSVQLEDSAPSRTWRFAGCYFCFGRRRAREDRLSTPRARLSGCSRTYPRIRHRHRRRRPPGNTRLVWLRPWSPDPLAGRRTHWPDRLDRRALPPLRNRLPRHHPGDRSAHAGQAHPEFARGVTGRADGAREQPVAARPVVFAERLSSAGPSLPLVCPHPQLAVQVRTGAASSRSHRRSREVPPDTAPLPSRDSSPI